MNAVRFALATMLFQVVSAQSGPQPPCGTKPVPPYPPGDQVTAQPATVKLWSRSDLGSDWKPPACTSWTAPGFTTLVTLAARFSYGAGAEGLLGRIGAISELKGIRYWSTTHKQWRTLIEEAHVLTGATGQRRADLTPAELKEGKEFYFEQVDNLTGGGVFRLQVVEASAARIVLQIENVTTLRYLLVPILHPGETQSIYFLDRESDSVWRFYSMVRTGQNANRLIAGNEASAINRAVALYRHFAGIPTDQEPPAAR
jgi:hypothetical protein